MKKFLIVDDDRDDRELFCEALGEVMADSICYNVVSMIAQRLAKDKNKAITISDPGGAVTI